MGKWHVGCAWPEMTPTYRGFDHFVGFVCSGAMSFTEKTNDGYLDLWNGTEVISDDRLSEDIRSSWIYDAGAEDFIRSHGQKQGNQPFFLYYAQQDPHSPVSDSLAAWQPHPPHTHTAPCTAHTAPHTPKRRGALPGAPSRVLLMVVIGFSSACPHARGLLGCYADRHATGCNRDSDVTTSSSRRRTISWSPPLASTLRTRTVRSTAG